MTAIINESYFRKKTKLLPIFFSCYTKAYFLAILTIVFLLCEIFFLSTYIDEFLGCVSLIFLVFYFFRNPNQLKKYKIPILLFSFFIIVTFVSTLINRLASWWPTLIDCIANFKNFTIFFALFFCLQDKKVFKKYISIMIPIALLFILSSFFFCFLSQIISIGSMRGTKRFGLYSFKFIYRFEHEFYYSLFFMDSIVIQSRLKHKQKLFLIFLSLLLAIATLKGPALIFSPTLFVLYIYYRHYKKIRLWMVAVLLLIIFTMGNYQITNYLMDTASPRSVFYKYGFITAINYFPFGSGFATFGSDMASRFYSSLYVQYGFNYIWGMGATNGWFLSDVGIAKFIAQSGFFGAAFFFSFYLSLFFLNKKQENALNKAFIVTVLLVLVIHSAGSSTFSNSSGAVGLASVAISLIDNKSLQ